MKGRGCDHLCLGLATIAGVLGFLSFVAGCLSASFSYGQGLLGREAALWYIDGFALLFFGMFCLLFVKVSGMHRRMCGKCGGDAHGSCGSSGSCGPMSCGSQLSCGCGKKECAACGNDAKS